jgi:hypothetical protein
MRRPRKAKRVYLQVRGAGGEMQIGIGHAPGATAGDAIDALPTDGIDSRLGRVGHREILAPFQDIAEQILQAPGVAGWRPDGIDLLVLAKGGQRGAARAAGRLGALARAGVVLGLARWARKWDGH